MSIAISTHGIHWPRATIIREQVSSLDVVLNATDVLDTEAITTDVLEVELLSEVLETTVEIVDSLTGEIVDDSLEIKLDPCE